MKAMHILVVALTAVIASGCNMREAELEKEVVQMQVRLDSLNSVMAGRDAYFDQIVVAINEVYADLEEVRQSEEQIKAQADPQEGGISATSSESRVNLLSQVEKVGLAIEENRKKVARLESRVKALNREHKGLDEMIASLKQELEFRSQTIAMLESNLAGLENEMIQKNQLLAEKDAVIQEQDTELNTVYYIVGTRSELEELGIISEEGGFLWGLLGSTPVLASGVDESLFNPFDLSAERSIEVEGEIEEIIPKRNEQDYLSELGEERSNLRILDPERFWQERFLVIVTG